MCREMNQVEMNHSECTENALYLESRVYINFVQFKSMKGNEKKNKEEERRGICVCCR